MKKKYLLFLSLLSFAVSQAQIINIPDANLKDALVNNNVTNLEGVLYPNADVDINNDGEIDTSEASQITILFLNNKGIASLEGLEYFANIEKLWLSDNSISEIDLTQFLSLETLYLTDNQISELDLSQNINLNYLGCSNNLLSILDLTQSVNLEQLVCGNNQLTDLDLTQNVEISQLNCDNNQLSVLDVTQQYNLQYFNCSYNQLTALDVTQNTELIEINTSVNSLSSLDVSQNLVLESLNCGGNQLVSLNLGAGANLETLSCSGNLLTSLDASQKPNLQTITSTNGLLTTLDVSGTPALEQLYCNDNQLTDLDVSESPNLNFFHCYNNQIDFLDLSQNLNLVPFNSNPNVIAFDCKNNGLTTLILKNGIDNTQPHPITSSSIAFQSFFDGNETLTYICDDEADLSSLRLLISGYFPDANTTVNSYCSFNPGGIYYDISGHNTYDLDGNGCDNLDSNFPNLQYNVTDGTVSESIFADASGDYYLPVHSGEHTITPQLENLNYFTVVPSSILVDFPTDSSPYIQDFCITPDGVHNDLEVILMPISVARPGFDAEYMLLYKNKGNTTLSGDIILTFNEDLMDVTVINPNADFQTEGQLIWNYNNLLPFQEVNIAITMNINTPTDPNFPVNGDDVLDFTATINPVSGDELPEDNSFELNQTVVNSFDPNDITCLEGVSIAPEKVGGFVHYTIRFENTGSASAVNIVVKDDIDPNFFDVSSLIPLSSSHDFITRITNDTVEFIFENINLPFDDANNDGYVTFKIKTLPTLELGDTFTNIAEIYFDFNAPIITNTASTTVAESLSLVDNYFNSGITMYPNPVYNNLFIKSATAIESILLYDLNGRFIQTITINKSIFEKELNVAELSAGVYFVKIQSQNGEFIQKLIKN